jgi:hypothetical protein
MMENEPTILPHPGITMERAAMSGPIVRQYGVPNWDEIFGNKEEPSNDAKQQAQSPEKPTSEQNSTSPSTTTASETGDS